MPAATTKKRTAKKAAKKAPAATPKGSNTAKGKQATGAEVRQWANDQVKAKTATWDNPRVLGGRGRIGHDIVRAYNKAHARRKYIPPAGLPPQA